MPFSKLPDGALPPLHASWLKQFLQSGLPNESRADCANCVMCQRSASTPNAPQVSQIQKKELIYFNPQTKCCTYVPYLANFLIGRILQEPDATKVPGRNLLQERLAKKIALTPLGLGRGAEFFEAYPQAVDAGEFGQDLGLRCPYYLHEQGGLCGVWQHRNAVCATWFCKHERGEPGMLFWRSVQELFSLAEKQLAFWCMQKVNPSTEALTHLNFPQEQESVSLYERELSEADYRLIWGDWWGREASYFVECAKIAENVSWPELLVIGGREVVAKAAEVRQAWRRLNSTGLPEFLEQGKYKLVSRDTTVWLQTYRKYDLLELPPAVFDSLPIFAPETPTTEVLAKLKNEQGLSISAELLQQLLDHAVLVPPGLDDLL